MSFCSIHLETYSRSTMLENNLTKQIFWNQALNFQQNNLLDTYSLSEIRKHQTTCVIVQIVYNQVQQFFIYLPPKRFSLLWQMRNKELCMLKQMLELPESNLRKFLKQAPQNFLFERLLNVINDNVPVNRQLLKNQEKSFQQLFSKETCLKKKRKIFVKKPELIRALGLSCYIYMKVEKCIQRSLFSYPK